MVRSADISRPSPSWRGIFALAEPALCYHGSMAYSDTDSRAMTQSDWREKSSVATYQTRVCHYAAMERVDGDAALDAYSELYGRVERKLFAEVAAGRSANIVEECVSEALWDTGADVQRGARVSGRQGGVGQGAAEDAARQLGTAACSG